jgi:inorganic pyrophosphatase
MRAAANPLSDLHAVIHGTGEVNVIVETPRGSRNKIKFDPPTGMFRLDKTLPAGAVFPYDFGFFPATEGEDGDPERRCAPI